MQKRKRLLSTIVILAALALTLSITACATRGQIEYVYVKADIPSWPVFPDPDAVAFDEGTDTVYMPLFYWQKIAEYKIAVDAIQSYITQLEDGTYGNKTSTFDSE